MPSSAHQSTHALRVVVMAGLIGAPLLSLMVVFTYGAILLPILGLALLAPFLLLNYVAWGWRSLPRRHR